MRMFAYVPMESEEACKPIEKNCDMWDYPIQNSEEACTPIRKNCESLCPDVSDLDHCVSCDTYVPMRQSLVYHMRRRLLGHVVQVIHFATDA